MMMAELRRSPACRPMEHDLRAVLDTIGYDGIEWRALPVDFPPWEAVYAFFVRWNERGACRRGWWTGCAQPGTGLSCRPLARSTRNR
jgi:transposase